MLPIDALMNEHRIIDRMIPPFKKELDRMQQAKTVNVKFIEKTVGFIRMYADRTHHGKEEGILFRELRKKQISNEHNAMMMDLINDHAFARRSVAALEHANIDYANGKKEAWQDVWKFLNDLYLLYPQHVQKEDTKFFQPSMEYFSRQERDAMMEEFEEFDQKIIHEEYSRVVGELENFTATQ
jgi:hemerythrin-like domain-containing protein